MDATGSYERLASRYRSVTWLGIVLNCLLALPLLFAPRVVLDILHLNVEPLIFARMVGMFMLFLSAFYIPPALDLKKYRVYAWLAVFVSRTGSAAFFLIAVLVFRQPMGFLAGAVLDLVILVPQLLILLEIRAGERGIAASVRAEVSQRRWRIAGVVAVIAGVIGFAAWYNLLREEPQQFASIEEYFKYGSIGAENAQGIPFWIWLVLPRVFPEYLPRPGGYNALGLYNEPGHDVPVGFSRKTIGFSRVGITCAVCHSGTIRLAPDEPPILLLAGAATTFDALSYQRFLFKSASDPRFNADRLLGEIAKNYNLSVLDRWLYRFVLIPATKKALLEQKVQNAWTDTRPDWGPGRIDPFNPVKVLYLGVGVGNTIGNSDMQPIWNMEGAPKRAYHWDGLNPSLTEVVRSSAIGDGATAKAIPLDDLQKLQDWLAHLPPPKYPAERFPIDAGRAAAGRPIFERECGACHLPGGKVVPAEVVGTDPHRAQMWTPEAAEAYNTRYKRYPWGFSQFRSTNGYVSVPMDAIWTRAPYLHNGSVPTLRDMLRAPEDRPTVFYRGYNVFDPKDVGLISQGPEAERIGFRYDVSQPGNSNQGHRYGTQLSDRDKDALIEYLKTL